MSEAPAYEAPYDERNEPDYWTARRVLDERRPRGLERTVWAVCPGCGLQKAVELQRVMVAGQGDKPICGLKLRCGCGEIASPKMTWVNPPKARAGRPAWRGQPRPGSYDFATGVRKGKWE